MKLFKYEIKIVLNDHDLKNSLDSFWNEIFKNKNDKDKLIIQFKILKMELQYRSISLVDIVTKITILQY